MDRGWWQKYLEEVRREFPGERVSRALLPPAWQVTQIKDMQHYNNSGAAAVSLAAKRGAEVVLMLGYDCQHTGGKRHWHGDHPKGLGNAGSYVNWAKSFEQMAEHMEKRGVKVINCSRETALKCFERMDLEAALARFDCR